MNDEKNGDVYIDRFDWLSEYLPKHSALFNGILEFFRTPGLEYDEMKMLEIVQNNQEILTVSTENEIINNLYRLYKAAWFLTHFVK